MIEDNEQGQQAPQTTHTDKTTTEEHTTTGPSGGDNGTDHQAPKPE